MAVDIRYHVDGDGVADGMNAMNSVAAFDRMIAQVFEAVQLLLVQRFSVFRTECDVR